jgi:hypothetical protein
MTTANGRQLPCHFLWIVIWSSRGGGDD